MARLLYRTAHADTAQGKERVLFLCHPADHAVYFESIVKDIFATQDCAVYYYDPQEGIDTDVTEWERMQLFVLPVTKQFLREPTGARDVLFQYAKDRHKSILPILEEEGIIDEFNAVCGQIQFLDHKQSAVDAVPFADKLSAFLSSVLVGNDLAPRIRAGFDAYIFLSYRKKDRAHAMELVQNIHAKETCLDVAVWYDEFLTPGENFNQTIREAMEKSRLFMLLITPSLLEEGNYVMTVEYPMARDAGMPILAVEAVPTDREVLAEKYPGLPPIIDGHDAEALAAALAKEFPPKELNDPWHLYLVGMAYYSGVDVEVNIERAKKLFLQASEHGVREAIDKVAEILLYQENNWVEGVLWLYTHSKRAMPFYLENGLVVYGGSTVPLRWSYEQITHIAQTSYSLQDGKIGDSLRQALVWLVGSNAHHYPFEFRGDLAMWYMELAEEETDAKYASVHSDNAILRAEDLAKEIKTAENVLLLAYLYTKKADFEEGEDRENRANRYRKKAWRLAKRYLKKELTDKEQERLAAICQALADEAHFHDMPKKAVLYANIAKERYERLWQTDTQNIDYCDGVKDAYNRLVEIENEKEEPNDALCLAYRQKIVDVWENLSEETFAAYAPETKASCRQVLGWAYELLIGELPQEKRLAVYEKLLDGYRTLMQETNGEYGKRDLAFALYICGPTLSGCQVAKEQFCAYYREALPLFAELAQEDEKDAHYYMECCRLAADAEENPEAAKDLYLRTKDMVCHFLETDALPSYVLERFLECYLALADLETVKQSKLALLREGVATLKQRQDPQEAAYQETMEALMKKIAEMEAESEGV